MPIITGTNIDSGEQMYWSNEYGWSSNRSEATEFTENERRTFGLPESDTIETISWIDA